MVDVNRHKFFLLQVLKDIYADTELASSLGFKGGTALMLFHDLPRFSVDLDFNLIKNSSDKPVYDKIRNILAGYGTIHDEVRKHYGMLLVLNYEDGDRNLKVEISNRTYPDEYEIKDYLGISMKVMNLECMFTHKFMALLDRSSLTSRDVFDCWFCMKQRLALRRSILELRLNSSFEDYIDRSIELVANIKSNRILDGMGELLDPDVKKWVKISLVSEFTALARIYKEMKLIK
ncbi:nucleotidyl transferase AbiEii/AbiGii toxin family protein [Verrucomicrobiota bacterium]